jgi:hypothetical protein
LAVRDWAIFAKCSRQAPETSAILLRFFIGA